jgi:hypothetical protein
MSIPIRAFVDTEPVNDKISQRLIQILEFRGLPQHASPLTPRPIIGLVGSVVQRLAAGLNLQLPQLKLLLTTRDYADIGTRECPRFC